MFAVDHFLDRFLKDGGYIIRAEGEKIVPSLYSACLCSEQYIRTGPWDMTASSRGIVSIGIGNLTVQEI